VVEINNDTLIDCCCFSDHLTGATFREGQLIGFSESEGRGRVTSGDLEPGGTVTIVLSGNPPRGEEGTLACCNRLVEALRQRGENWENPVEIKNEPHIDAMVSGYGSSEGRVLKIQVVRALTKPDFWCIAAKNNKNILKVTPRKAADILKDAICLKVGKIIDANIRRGITLVLDATDVPGLVIGVVLEAFDTLYGVWVRGQGFESVWIVGPWWEMVYELSLPKPKSL